MKIALLNMRYDNNYGGNLQRFALYTILKRMGYDVEYLYIRDNWDDWFTYRSKKKIIKQSIKQFIRFLLHPTKEPLLAWHREDTQYANSCAITEPFLNKYIKHTKPICNSWELRRAIKRGKYDAVVAGSDQIWRKLYTERYGVGTFFLNFLPNTFNGKRIIYGASFGVDYEEYTQADIAQIQPYYSKLDLVTVRESSALDLLKKYQLTNPQAQVVLDPTLLLDKEDYIQIVKASDTTPSPGNMFCYILDMTEEKREMIDQISNDKNLTPFEWALVTKGSVEQWLRSFMDAEYVVTDSYHGMLFSIIFNKPFKLVRNQNRGNARFDEVINKLNFVEYDNCLDWKNVNNQLNQLKESSIKSIVL